LPTKFAARFTACFALASCFSLLSTAQQTTPPAAQTQAQSPAQSQPTSSTQQQSPAPDKDKAGKDANGKPNDRLFFALPNYLSVENAGKVPPLTAKQKFVLVGRGAFDKVQLPWYGALAALSQAENSEPAFGQGWEGYGKRFGTAAADGTIENFIVGAVLPSLLHQDPRFFQSEEGSFGHRAGYAVTRIFVTRTDSGHHQFNFSEIVGSAMSASISTFSYHPRSTYVSTPTNPRLFIPSDRTLSNTAKVWGTQVGYDTITIVIKEFWPDLHRKMAHKRANTAASTTP